jgi:hypothetical protein
LTLEGQVKKVGVFPAQIHFNEPVYVTWTAPENPFTELHLGHFELARIGVAAGHGRIKQLTEFIIDDEPAFARFTECTQCYSFRSLYPKLTLHRLRADLITQEEFTWRLRSKNLKVVAFGFIGTASGLDFVKASLSPIVHLNRLLTTTSSPSIRI